MLKQSLNFFFLTFFVCGLASAQQLPVEAFGNLPDVRGVRLSPDGSKAAAIVNIDRQEFKGSAVVMYDFTKNATELFAATDNQKYVMSWLAWANDNVLLISARFPMRRFGVPTVESRMIKVDTNTGKTKPLISINYLEKQGWIPQFQDNIIDFLDQDKDHILMSLKLTRSIGGTKVLKVPLGKGNPKNVTRTKEHIFGWVTDRQHKVRIAKYFKDTTQRVLERDPNTKKWRTLWEFETLSEDQVTPLGFDEDPNVIFVNAYHEGRLAIFKADLNTPDIARELVYSDPDYDVRGTLVYSAKNKRVVGIRHTGNNHFTFWDSEYDGMLKSLNTTLPDTDNIILDLSEDETKVLILSTSDTNAGVYSIWDRSKATLSQIARRYEALSPDKMSKKSLVSYQARDGLTIEGYLTKPVDAPEGKLPTIVFPHGGPISHDGKGFDYWTQFFANRGYAVLQMNFRGSSGYGYDFLKSGLQSWGLKMQHDVEDGTRWLIEQGIADPKKICVVGASYGGYAALMEAASGSGLYQCAVSFAGVTDLPYLVQSHSRYLNAKVVKQQIGTDKSELKKRSPIHAANRMDIPVLLVQGSKDRVVRPKHGSRMHKALKKAGKHVRYIEQKDGTHYLSNQEHRLQLFKEMDKFLATHLN